MNASSQPQLFLNKQTFVCLTDNTLVFLDLHKDKYSCLEPHHTKPIMSLFALPAPPAQTDVNTTDVTSDNTDRVVRDLINAGLVTRNPNEGKHAELITQYGELREMPGYEIGKAPKIHASHLFNFFRALATTKYLLRFSSIERTVTKLKRRKERYHARGGARADEERVNELVEIYKILKPLFVTVKDECLFNSIFLIEFLSYYNIYPSWYFGVRLNEFYAHCWVQSNNVIYDDFIQNTCQNQPIMVV